jgi:glucokinase
MDLIADVGATNTRCALLDDKGHERASEVFQNADFTGLLALLSVYLDHRRASDRPKRAALAVAAPILGDEVRMINLDWRFSQADIRSKLGLSQLVVCNDFAAVAWGLPQLKAADLKKIGGGRGAEGGTLAAVGPGTGLGVAALVASTDGWAVVAGEGGHVSMPAITAEEERVVERIRRRHGNCSAERLLSGPGLVNLYVALAELAGRGQPTVTPHDVTALAKQSEPLARKALGMFFAMLGTVAGDVALTVGARGGVFIAGGIVPTLLESFAKSEFRERFEAKDGYGDYMRAIPTHVITTPIPAFRGLRQLLGYR